MSANKENFQKICQHLRNVRVLSQSGRYVEAIELLGWILARCTEMSNDASTEEQKYICKEKIEECRTELQALTSDFLKDDRDPGSQFEMPDVTPFRLNSIIGMDAAKSALLETILLPIMLEGTYDAAQRFHGVLLFGLSGIGKSTVVKAVVNEANNRLNTRVTYIDVKLSDITDSLLGGTERNLTALFKRAEQRQPAVVHIDEIDSLMRKRTSDERECHRNVKNHLLSLMDDLAYNSKVVIVGTTNKITELDDAFKRRFGKRVYVALPSKTERSQILGHYVSTIQGMNLHDINLNELAARTDRFSPADLKLLVKMAYHSSNWAGHLNELKHCIESGQTLVKLSYNKKIISHADLIRVLKKLSPSNDSQLIEDMEEFAKQHATDMDSQGSTASQTPHPLESKECLKNPLRAAVFCLFCCCGTVKR